MTPSLGTAHSWSVPKTAGFDFLPLVVVVIAILILRFVLLRPLSGWNVTASAVAGTLWAWWVETVGFAMPTVVALVLLALAAVPARRGSA